MSSSSRADRPHRRADASAGWPPTRLTTWIGDSNEGFVADVVARLLEKLKGDRANTYSIRINDQWRICFRWTAAGPEDVEIVDYH